MIHWTKNDWAQWMGWMLVVAFVSAIACALAFNALNLSYPLGYVLSAVATFVALQLFHQWFIRRKSK